MRMRPLLERSIIALFCCSVSVAHAGDQCIVYENGNFDGVTLALSMNQSLPLLGASIDNKISSVRVHSGCILVGFADANFKGIADVASGGLPDAAQRMGRRHLVGAVHLPPAMICSLMCAAPTPHHSGPPHEQVRALPVTGGSGSVHSTRSAFRSESDVSSHGRVGPLRARSRHS